MLSRSRTRLREASRHASALQVTVRAADLHESARARTPPGRARHLPDDRPRQGLGAHAHRHAPIPPGAPVVIDVTDPPRAHAPSATCPARVAARGASSVRADAKAAVAAASTGEPRTSAPSPSAWAEAAS